MLDFEGDVENTFMQTFRISYTDVFGATLSHDLKDNGDDVKVTKQNRQVTRLTRNYECLYVWSFQRKGIPILDCLFYFILRNLWTCIQTSS